MPARARGGVWRAAGAVRVKLLVLVLVPLDCVHHGKSGLGSSHILTSCLLLALAVAQEHEEHRRLSRIAADDAVPGNAPVVVGGGGVVVVVVVVPRG